MENTTRRPTEKARALRTEATGPERILWNYLRASRLNGFKFSRQIPIDVFICDLVCRSQRLVIELDGDSHSGRERQDTDRTKIIESHGYRLIRFWNNDVSQNIDWVIEQIRAALPDVPSKWGRAIGRGSGDIVRRPAPTGRGEKAP